MTATEASPPPIPEPRWIDVWGASFLPTKINGTLQPVPEFHNQTLRQNMFLKLGGTMLRVKVSNRFSRRPVTIGEAHVALRRPGNGPGIVPETDRVLKFNGAKTLRLEPGEEEWSDPAVLMVRQHEDLAVSLYLPEPVTPESFHPVALKTQYLAGENRCGDATLPQEGPNSRLSMVFFVSGIQVQAPTNAKVIVALGDSITDGAASALDVNGSWPDILSKRLPSLRDGSPVSVINMGIGSNRLLASGEAGPPGIARLDRDVLSRSNVTHLILLEGINDISYEHTPTAALIGAYEQIIERAHARGVKVIGATLLPIQNSRKDTPENEATRQAVNEWIRNAGRFDAVVDFEKVVRDPQNPLRFRKNLTGDYVHPNTEGYRLMGEAIPLDLFEPAPIHSATNSIQPL